MSDNEIMIVDERSLKDKIYVIRGQQVMLDFDLAEIYGYTVSAFNQQVKRNIDRFPEDFLFELTSEEMEFLSKSQNVISIQTREVKGGRSKPKPSIPTLKFGSLRLFQNIELILSVKPGYEVPELGPEKLR